MKHFKFIIPLEKELFKFPKCSSCFSLSPDLLQYHAPVFKNFWHMVLLKNRLYFYLEGKMFKNLFAICIQLLTFI